MVRIDTGIKITDDRLVEIGEKNGRDLYMLKVDEWHSVREKPKSKTHLSVMISPTDSGNMAKLQLVSDKGTVLDEWYQQFDNNF